jgi:hypothetical protein
LKSEDSNTITVLAVVTWVKPRPILDPVMRKKRLLSKASDSDC